MLIPLIAVAACLSAQPTQPAEVTGRITPEHVRGHIEGLVSFGTRHTLSDTTSDTRGIGAARRWIRDQMTIFAEASHGRMTVSLDGYMQPPMRRITEEVEVVNVVAVLPGAMPEAAARHYYVIGHYDSRASGANDATGDAPGANDDGSGTAVVMELARVLADQKLDATVVFMATAGEEQGLLGATWHAEQAAARGVDIRAVLSNDIVGDPSGPPRADGTPRSARDRIRLFSEGVPRNPTTEVLSRIRSLSAESDSSSRQLARFVAEVADKEEMAVRPMLVFRPDRFLRGGDHTPFNQRDFAAVRFTEVYENYDRQHQDVRTEEGRVYGDAADGVDAGYLADVARLNAAVIVHLANAPTSPPNARIIVAALTNDTTLRWNASPEPDVAGYEVVWRETTSPQWQGARDVGPDLEATLELSKDNYFFGVRAYDADGYRSPVVFPGVGRR